MAKKSFFGTAARLAAAAAAAAAVYYKREEIRGILREVRDSFFDGGRTEADEPEGWEDGEGEIVIDMTGMQQRQEKEEEEENGEA